MQQGGERPSVVTVGLSPEANTWLRERSPGASIRDAGSSEQLRDALSEVRSAVLIVNHSLGGPAGVDAVNEARQASPNTPVIYILDKRLDSDLGRGLLRQMGITDPLLAPVDPEEILRRVRELLGLPEPLSSGAAEQASPQETLSDAAPAAAEDVPADEGAVAAEPGTDAVAATEPATAEAADEEAGTGETAQPEPDKQASAEPPADETTAGASRDRHFLLVIDDAADLTERIVTEATTYGMRVVATSSVLEGRLLLARERPDAVLLDLGLTTSSDEGLALLEELDGHVLSVPVLFLAERDSFIERVQAVSLGGRAFLPKTMPPADILKAVTRLLQQLQATESRVLAVDDDPQVLADLRTLLEPTGIKLTTLEDPLRFWSTLEESVPDLLMVDADLPRWTGLELCRVVRNDTRWSALPVLCLTSNANSETVQRVFDAGADDFVSKPIVGPELVTKVVNRLQRIQLYRIMAEIDPLTGVANRFKAMDALDRLLRLARRQRQVFSLAYLDLDNFKQINDRFGHGTGDEALRRLGNLLTRTFRTEDVVARLGGEEFIVGMYGMPRIGGVHRLASLLGVLSDETPPRMRDDNVDLTFSAGVAQYPEDAQDLEGLMESADAALFRAKSAGKSRVFPAVFASDIGAGGTASTTDVVVVSASGDAPRIIDAVDALGYRSQLIKDGETAAMKLGGTDPPLCAQVVLLDLDVPRLDGIGVLSRLNRDSVVSRTRIIVMGTEANEARLRKALELGAFDSVTRPLNLPNLQQRVRHAMEVP